MTALESLVSYFLPRRRRALGPSNFEKALAATDDLIARMRLGSFEMERDTRAAAALQRAAIEARQRL